MYGCPERINAMQLKKTPTNRKNTAKAHKSIRDSQSVGWGSR